MTAQAPETLIYRGETLTLCTEPLKHVPVVSAMEREYAMPSTALWRRYLGTWQIESDRLYLKQLRCWKDAGGSVLECGLADLFTGFPEGVFAHWYTGELRCPRGALLKYVHGGFASTYEEDLFLRVKKGVLVGERIVRNGTASPDAEPGYRINAMTLYL